MIQGRGTLDLGRAEILDNMTFLAGIAHDKGLVALAAALWTTLFRGLRILLLSMQQAICALSLPPDL